ncbi:MAG TPA: acetyl-CoA carboxylase carboxyltransferase subunit alpha [Firmicutes bacterium]|nr:acetyl-CoA carboxylase carboxyltransferase subunit alpha [Bacillota bacterium]
MTNGSLDFEKPLYELEKRIAELRQFTSEKEIDLSAEIRTLEQKAESLRQQIYANLSSWQRVLLARHPRRPLTLDYIDRIFDDFIELHGDRNYRDDKAIVGGLALLDGRPVTVIGEQKGKDTKENIARSFGWPYPEGYRKALRLMRQAEKFGRPVVTFIDTAGAFPGLEAEERGQAEAIARNLFEMAQLEVPIVCVVIGEGGSGGALAIGVGDRVYMLENAVYSVISPEGCAAILWHDAELKTKAADALRLTAADLLNLGVIHGVVPEPVGGAHRDYDEAARNVKETIVRALKELEKLSPSELKEQRYAHYRRLGEVRQGES